MVPSGGEWVCISVIGRIQLPPAGRESRTFVWATAPFAPGRYSVYGTFAAEGVRLATPVTAVQLH